MRAVIILAVVAYVAAQNGGFLGNIFNFGRGDHIHGYTFQYHQREDLLLVMNRTVCIIVDADKDVAAKLEHRDSREALEDAIYLQIKADQGLTVAKLSDLRSDYHDALATLECSRHTVYKLTVSA